ncbi:MAG: HD domain-containing protein [Candidatus Pelethousia sp.]|nr:HD domain-containing protein [Candidatus Pelethousia sp.]
MTRIPRIPSTQSEISRIYSSPDGHHLVSAFQAKSLLKAESIVEMIHHALNMVDTRLVDHGLRVARILYAMLQADNGYELLERQRLCAVALLHDIGAYRTDEIDRLLSFEAGANMWSHAIYGYLFLRELSPLDRWSQIVLYHHMRYDKFIGVDPEIARLAQMLHVADRVDVYLLRNQQADHEDILKELRKNIGSLSSEAIDLFDAADQRWNLMDNLRQGVKLLDVFHDISVLEDRAAQYLQMLVHAIDFRSRHTVTHSINTTHICCLLARRLGLNPLEMDQIYSGALIHDLGKIGIPLHILEKPGKLEPEETVIMRSHVDLTELIIRGRVDETIARIALRHHEKLDGSGYPKHLTGDQLTFPERIVAVSDIVSALGSSRSYKAAFPKNKVLAILGGMRDRKQLDSEAVHCIEVDFDTIMAEAANFYRPVEELYRHMMDEYASLLLHFRNFLS